MDRRIFLKSTCALLSAFKICPLAMAAAAEKSPENNEQNTNVKQSVPPFTPGSWTLVILPDTQHYAESYPGLLRLQTQWIAENKDKLAIACVLQLGDLTQHNNEPEWECVSRAFEILDNVVPYAIVPGNHDYTYDKAKGLGLKRASTRINDYFPPHRFQKWPTFGGTMTKEHIENNYHLFEAGGRKWIIIGLEWGPRDEALQWADGLLSKHSDRKAIVFTHAYLYSDSTRYDWNKKSITQHWNPHDPEYNTIGSANDGEEIWQKLVKKHADVFMVMNGHVLNDGLGFQVSKGEHGNPVNEMLVNYQMQKVGGGGWLRMLEFLPDRQTVRVRTYSPFYDRYKTDLQNQFEMRID